MNRKAACTFLVSLIWTLGASAGEKLEATVAETGLSRLAWAGAELLKDGKPAVKRIVFEREALDENKVITYAFDKLDGANPKVSFDAAAKQLTYGYAWGSVSFVYAPGADRLGLTITLTNDSKLPLADFEIAPLTLNFGSAPTKPKDGRWVEAPPERVPVIEAVFGTQKLLLCCESMFPVHMGLAAGGKPESEVVVKGGVAATEPGAVFFHYLGLPRVDPGKSLAIKLSLRFSSSEACKWSPLEPANNALLADLYDAFRKYHQPRLEWKDHRPIGTVFMGEGKGPEGNPRNWFPTKKLDRPANKNPLELKAANRKSLDVKTPEGKEDLRKVFLAFADDCIRSLKNANAQGVVIWDPEGSENPHPITYIGDPRLVKLLAPEADDIYPEFFKKFLDAGLRTGCCLRPTQVYYSEPKKKWEHGTGSHAAERNPLNDDFSSVWPKGLPWWRFYPVVERMCRKIEYAKKNWGCTIFYVDTNGIFRQFGEKQDFGWSLLESHIWRDIMKRHPDILLIPELGTGGQAPWAYVAQYLQPPHSGATTPSYVSELFPGAFSVCQSVNLSPAEWDKKREQFLDGVRRGDSMFFRGWFDDGYNAKIKALFDEVSKAGGAK